MDGWIGSERFIFGKIIIQINVESEMGRYR